MRVHQEEWIMKIVRLAALAAAAFAFGAAPLAQAQDKVSLRLNWYLGGLHVPFYYGKDKGYYAAEGIDLTINEGRGSGNTVQVVAAGSDTFGLADSSSVIVTASKGADVKSVMSLLNTTGFSVVSLAEAGIKTPKDLEGKKVAVTPGDPLGQLLQAVCKANNVDCTKIGMVQVDPAAKVVTVLEKKADALLGGADDQYFLIKYKGGNPAAMRYADWGANIVGMTILTSGDTIKKNPDLVRRFVRATVKSWEEAKKNPGAAVDAAMKVKPDLNRQSTLDQLMVDIDLLDSKNSKGKIGMGAQADWDQTLAILKNYRDLQTDKKWTDFHTNEFVPK
jgi:NitT/TauT family transport system substrate-binding protein